MTPVDTLTELQYSEDRRGPWKLYVYGPNGYHDGGKWFRAGKPEYPDEEIGITAAKVRCANAMRKGWEVRICDGGDMLVFHAKGPEVLYGQSFWLEIAS